MSQAGQHEGDYAQDQHPPVALPYAEVQRIGIYRAEQEDQRPVAGKLGEDHQQGTDGQQEGGEQRRSSPHQAAAHRVERGYSQHPEHCGQEPQPELVEGSEWRDHVMVQEVEQRPGVSERGMDRVAKHEDFIALEAPGSQAPEAQHETEQHQRSEQQGRAPAGASLHGA